MGKEPSATAGTIRGDAVSLAGLEGQPHQMDWEQRLAINVGTDTCVSVGEFKDKSLHLGRRGLILEDPA